MPSILYKIIHITGDAFFVFGEQYKMIYLKFEKFTLVVFYNLFIHVQYNLKKPCIPESCVTANTTLEECIYINHIDNFYRNVKASETLIVAIIIGKESVCRDAVNR